MELSSKRAGYVSLAGLVLSLAFFGVTWYVYNYCGIFASQCIGWFFLGQSFVWLYLLGYFHHQNLADIEKRDLAILSESKSDTIFQAGTNQQELLAVAQRRFANYSKWGTPIFSALVALYNIGVGIWLFLRFRTIKLNPASADIKDVLSYELRNEMPAVCILAAVALISFLISRYASGMSSETKWKPLRAGASWLIGACLMCFVTAIVVAVTFLSKGFVAVLDGMAWAVPVIMVLLGLETGLNAVLDVYRPRIKGQYHRPAFDSRLLGIFSEAGGILHTAASAIDYQFGFKVSQTWFYKLLEKAIVPLVIFSALVLWLMSSFVIVGTGEQTVIERYGKITRIADPGLHFKMPWPIDIAYRYNTEQVKQIEIGYNSAETEKADGAPNDKVLLWGEKHYENEYELLVALPQSSGNSEDEKTAPCSKVIAAVPVQYKITDVEKFHTQFTDPEVQIKAIAQAQLVKFAASSILETNVAGFDSLLGSGRAKAGEELAHRIQAGADADNLGIKVVMVGLQGVHPPVEVAKEYQAVLGAVQQQQTEILNAETERIQKLVGLVGSLDKVEDMYRLVKQYQEAVQQDSPEQAEIIAKLDAAFADADGQIFRVLSDARTYSFNRVLSEKSTAERFLSQLNAYKASPLLYKQQMRLSMLEEVLSGIRKYVVLSGEGDTEMILVDLKQQMETEFFEVDASN